MTKPIDANRNALTSQSRTALTTNSCEQSVVQRMVDEALKIARRQATQLVRETFKVGNFELCEPDYRQVLRWAKALGMEPEDVLAVLSQLTCENHHLLAKLRIEGGSIKELIWDGDRLPVPAFEWEAGLEINTLTILKNMPSWSTSQELPLLRTLRIFELERADLDLSPVPGLTCLECSDNQLTELDLSPIPGLRQLSCYENQLTELDLSPVPGLKALLCNDNQLTELDLSPAPGLTVLWCGCNQLTELDLRPLDNPNVILKFLKCNPNVRIIR